MTRRGGPRRAAPAVAAKATRPDATTAVKGARCISCAVNPLEWRHLSWCPDATPSVGEALRDAHDLEAAIAWEPKVKLPKLTPAERRQLARLFDALVRERGHKPRRLWTLKGYRDHVARKSEGAA